jgi:DNA repair exonuclease SbcCD ATPase subunit
VPIDEYAAREGLSRDLVEECGKLGIVQLRTYKGETFVVNVPISPYLCVSETAKKPVRPVDKNTRAQKISELMQRVASEKSIPQKKPPMAASEGPTESSDKSVKPGAISHLIKKMFDNAAKITEKQRQVLDDAAGRADRASEPSQSITPKTPRATTQPARSTNDASQSRPARIKTPGGGKTTNKPMAAPHKTRQARPLPPVQPPDMEIFELPDESPEIVDDTDPMYESAQIPQDDGYQLSILTAQARSKRIWQTTAVLSLGLLFMTLVVSIPLLVNRQSQLDQAQTSIQRLFDDSTQSSQRLENLQAELSNSSAQAGLFQSNLDKSRAELQTARNELTQARQETENIRTELGKSRAEAGRLRNEVSESSTEATRLQRELDKSKAELKTVQDKLAAATRELRTIRQRNSEAAVRLNKRIQQLTARLNKLNKDSQN